MTSSDIVIDVEAVRMRYGSTDVLHDVTFRVGQGELVALLGPNGAGKTTTIEILEGFRARSAGRVTVLGLDPAHVTDAWRARVGIVLQSWRDHNGWRVRELLAHFGSYHRRYSTATSSRPWPVDDLLAAVGLDEHAHKQIRMLSGGQRRRLDVAIAVVGRPEVLFLDEPTAGLDPQARREFHDLIQDLIRENATTILLTTHDLHEAERLADRVMILNRGSIIANGTVPDLAQQIVGLDEVRWAHQGSRYAQHTNESTRFVIDLVRRHGDSITDLEVRRSTLEDTYLSLVHRADSGEHHAARADMLEATR